MGPSFGDSRRGFHSEVLADVDQNASQHILCQPAGERVLLAGMVGDEQARQLAGERVARTVGEAIPGGGLDTTARAEQAEVAAQGDAAQGEYGARLQNLEIAFEIRAAVRKLRWQRFIRGRRASQR